MGGSSSVPADSPLGKVLKRWARFSCARMTKESMRQYCTRAWPGYDLGAAGPWPAHGSLDPDALLQLERCCLRAGRAEELPYVRAFRALLEREQHKRGGKGLARRRRGRQEPTTPGLEPGTRPARAQLALLQPASPSGRNPSPLPWPQEEHPILRSETKPVQIPSVFEVGSPHQNSVCPPSRPEEHPMMTSETKPVLIPSVFVVGSPHQNSVCPPSPPEEPPMMTSETKPVLIPSVFEVRSPHQNSVCPPSPPEEHPMMTSETKPVLIPSVFVVGSPHQNSVCSPSPLEEHPMMTSETKPVLIPSVFEVRSPHQNSVCSPSPPEDPIMNPEPEPILIPSVWEVGPRPQQHSLYPPLPVNLVLECDPGLVAGSVLPSSHTLQGTQFGLGVCVSRAAQSPQRQCPVGSQQGRPLDHWANDLELLKSHCPAYKVDPQGITELFASIFATHRPSWSHLQTLMDSLLTAGEKILVVHKARQEAGRLHQENPAGYLAANTVVPYGHPCWDPNAEDLPEIEHYRRCILVGLEEAACYYSGHSYLTWIQQHAYSL